MTVLNLPNKQRMSRGGTNMMRKMMAKKPAAAKKKMMGGGMTKKMYKHGGKVKKCKIDGIARKGKTRAGRKK